MNIVLWVLVLLPATSGAVTSYYNNYGTYEGQSVRQGDARFYYNYRGDYMGQAVETPPARPNPPPVYAPSIHLAPVPGSYNGINMPDVDMIGDPE